MSSQDESSRKAKTTRKKNKMKEKKTLQVRDLTPTKDVRGGNRHHRGHRGHAFAFGLHRQEDLRQARRGAPGIFMLPQ